MENLPNEIWKPVPNYEGLYEVSNMGRMKALEKTRTVGRDRGFRTYPEKIMKGTPTKYGHLLIKLCNHGKHKRTLMHLVVAHAFLDYVPYDTKIVVDHKNNIPYDNRLENLQIITQRVNRTKDAKGNTSKYPGVFVTGKTWSSHIYIEAGQVWLGSFKCEIEAAIHYKTAVKNIHLYAGNKGKFREEIKRLVSELK